MRAPSRKTREFYERLGLSFEREQHGAGPIHHAHVPTDPTVLEIYPVTDHVRTDAVIVYVDDLRARVAELTGDRPGANAPMYMVSDPDGRSVLLMQRKL